MKASTTLRHVPSPHIRPSLPAFSKFSNSSSASPFHSSSLSLFIHPLHKSSTTCKRIHRRTPIACSFEREFVNEAPAKVLRRILDSPGVHQGPACFDALSARLVQRAGFQYCFTSGFSISAARLGLPDTGYISYGEMVDQGQQITQAVSIPVIGDADNGYGNAMNVKRTVKGYIRAGFAGIILEDQVSPKACGHTKGRKVVSKEEAVMRIKAAVDARIESGSDIVIVARTDSRQAVSLDEALRRSRAFADAGADVLFIDALASREEMKAFCEVFPLIPKMANMLEGGGKTPILNPQELEDIGYKLVAYPLSLIGVSIQAMLDSLTAIRGGRIPPPGSMPSFEEIKDILGFNTYYEEEKRYATSTDQLPSKRESPVDSFARINLGENLVNFFGSSVYVEKLFSRPCTQPYPRQKEKQLKRERSESSSLYSIQRKDQVDTEETSQSSQEPIVEVITPDVYNKYGADSSRDPFSRIWSRALRIKITGRDGFEKLDVRIPAGFLEGVTNIVPALGGVNLKELLDDAAEEVGGKLLLDFNDTGGDRIQVFLE